MTERLLATRQLNLKMAILGTLPAVLLLDTGVAIARGWQPKGYVELAIVTSAAMALGSIILIAGSRSGRSLLHEHGDSLVYMGYSAVGAWLAAEAVVGCLLWYYPSIDSPLHVHRLQVRPADHVRPANAHWVFRPDKSAFPGVEGVSHYTTNSIGIRGPEFPPRDSAYRILAIGGSSTECTYLDDTETWPRLLMERLNQEEARGRVWVGSAGISGFPTVNHLRFIEESPLMREVDALVLLVGANDFNQFLRGRLREGEFRDGTGDEKQDGVEDALPVWRHSPILRLVRGLWYRRTSSSQAEDLTGRNLQARRVQRQQSATRDTLPDMTRALREYEARLETIVRLARGYGLRVVFVTQPTLWNKNLSERGRALLWLGDITKGQYISVEAGRAGIDKHNDVLTKVCKRMDVECISTESMHGQERYFYDDFHFTEAGARELARLVAEHFLDRASSDRWGESKRRF